MDHECELSVDQHKDEPEVNGPQILSWSFQEVTVKNPVILSGEPIIVVIGHLLNKGSPGITGSWIPKAPMKGFVMTPPCRLIVKERSAEKISGSTLGYEI